VTTAFALDRMVLVNAQDEPIAYFYSQKELYTNIAAETGVREYRASAQGGQTSDGIFMPTQIATITGAGVAVPVTVRGEDKKDRARILIATRLVSSALSGGGGSLIGKKVKVKGPPAREFTVKTASIERKAVFTP